MKTRIITALTVLITVYALPASAQEVLPFPPTPSASEAGLTMQTSTYKKELIRNDFLKMPPISSLS